MGDDKLRNKHLLTLTFFLFRENQLRGGKEKKREEADDYKE